MHDIEGREGTSSAPSRHTKPSRSAGAAGSAARRNSAVAASCAPPPPHPRQPRRQRFACSAAPHSLRSFSGLHTLLGFQGGQTSTRSPDA